MIPLSLAFVQTTYFFTRCNAK